MPSGPNEVAIISVSMSTGTISYDINAVGGNQWCVLSPSSGIDPNQAYGLLGTLCPVTLGTPADFGLEYFGLEYLQYVGNVGNAVMPLNNYQVCPTWEESAEEKKAREEATEKAEELLRSLLSEEQEEQFRKHDYFDLKVSDKHYRLRRGRVSNVCLMDGEKIISTYCAHPPGGIPVADVLISQLLLLQHDEAQFLAVANRNDMLDTRGGTAFTPASVLDLSNETEPFIGTPEVFNLSEETLQFLRSEAESIMLDEPDQGSYPEHLNTA